VTRNLKAVPDQAYKYPHVVEAVLDQFSDRESKAWRVGDALLEDIGEPVAVATGSPFANTGLWAELEEAYLEAKNAGARELHPRTLSHSYHTARLWPPETRIPIASFEAHKELNGREDRHRRLATLAAESQDGWVSRDEVRLWKQGLEPPKLVPFLEQVEGAVRTALKRKVIWTHLGDDDRRHIVRMLKTIAEEVAAEEFGQ
jgi:hypothetical protein